MRACWSFRCSPIIALNGFSKGGGKEGSKEELRRVSGNFFFRVIVFFIQFCLPIAVALTVVKALMPSISDDFGVLLASGFIGGHGTGLRYDLGAAGRQRLRRNRLRAGPVHLR